ncbi:ribosome recycling factor [Candidatus Saganbacteria bacterium]|nr:ribosome recycling factor [Candidatus Saganbacteria bacterium]
MSDAVKDAEAKMNKALEALKKSLASVRTGRASPTLVDHLIVEYYGAPTPLQQLAGISVPESRTIKITPYDKSAAGEIEKAILKSNLGVTPKMDAGVVILNLPPLTEERRKELVKMIKKDAEESKVSLRNVRREAMDLLKAAKDKKELSEDLHKIREEELEKLTTHKIQEIDKQIIAKEKEIMEV